MAGLPAMPSFWLELSQSLKSVGSRGWLPAGKAYIFSVVAMPSTSKPSFSTRPVRSHNERRVALA